LWLIAWVAVEGRRPAGLACGCLGLRQSVNPCSRMVVFPDLLICCCAGFRRSVVMVLQDCGFL
jgi:hypothetical protein